MEQNKTRFYLIRHGETDWNKGGRYQGCTNIQLNDAGREQARLLGERFKFLPLDVVYVSPLDRAVATAAPLAAAHGLTPIQDAHFREINFGEWEGHTIAELKVERGKRVFPVSDRSLDVVLALEKYLKKNGVKLHLESPVEGILIADGRAEGIRLKNGKEERADGVIVCTGGLSYPGTGSTGDGYRFAKAAGHHVTKLYPSLVPLRTEEDWCHELMGLSLKNIEITIKNKKGKKVYSDFGEMLFTHFGVSGPVILSASRHIILTIEEGYRLYIDLKPAMDEKKLDARILRDFEKFANKDFANALDALLPQKLIPVIIRLSGIDARKKVNSVTKEERKRLVGLLKELPLTITGTTGYNEAVVTCGGIQVNEIDPATMESKFVKQLHFAGEVLDVDAYTGGFNLQIAFSTGFAAGNAVCAE